MTDPAEIPVTRLKGVGPKVAQKLERLSLFTVQDVLFHLPHRYQDRTCVVPLGSVRPGRAVSISGIIEVADVVFRGRRNLVCQVSDGTGFLTLRFFHFNSLQQQRLQRGMRVFAYGEIRGGRKGPEMIHPEYEVVPAEEEAQTEAALTPVYPATEGVHQLTLRNLTTQALHHVAGLAEYLDKNLLPETGWPTLAEAVRGLHQPAPDDGPGLETGKHPYQQRLAFEELLAHHLGLKKLRSEMQAEDALPIAPAGAVWSGLLKALPFAPTAAQTRVIDEIRTDLAKDKPMQRLVQGDVGCGKTLVAAAAAALAMEAGQQVAVMAPTELLAEQHLGNFRHWFEPLGIIVIPLTGKLGSAARESALSLTASGEAQLIVGTHALFQEGVQFHSLSLVVVDEQHRFGVQQRLALREKGGGAGRNPHQLIMSATPIPRTLAQSLYADLDVSVIDELPPGRKPVQTVVIADSRRAEVVERMLESCRAGRQAYWVCPLIEESEALQLQTATDTARDLTEALPELRVGLVHGRMKAVEKDQVMARFKKGALDVLVATTVIEVGVDVPNASLMVIEHAERLGLSQLHQLRGRVGRGDSNANCVLLYQSPLSRLARERLGVLRETTDGFEVAQRDLELRGPGELWGSRQTGLPRMLVADLARDQALLPAVQRAAAQIMSQAPGQASALIRRWLRGAESLGRV